MSRRTSWRSANYRYVAQPGDPPSTEPKPMKARFAGKCELCNGQIQPGDDMLWIPATRKARHQTCPANPVPAQAIPQIACPKCGQQVYQQTSKYGKPYFTNSTNRQDFHPCRVWTGRRRSASVAPKATASAIVAAGLMPRKQAEAIVGILDPTDNVLKTPDEYATAHILQAVIDNDDRTWTAVQTDLERIDKRMRQVEDLAKDPNAVGDAQAEYTDLVTEKTRAINRLALLTWERIRYDS